MIPEVLQSTGASSMNGKKAKRLRRSVREFLGMETLRVDGTDLNKVGTDQYQQNQSTGEVRRAPQTSGSVYKRYKQILKKGVPDE